MDMIFLPNSVKERVFLRIAIYLFAFFSVVFFYRNVIGIVKYSTGYDFLSYYTAAQLIKNGYYGEIYTIDPQNANEVASPLCKEIARKAGISNIPTPFIYPPIYVLPFLPLTVYSFQTARKIWIAVCAFFMLLSLPLLYPMVRFPEKPGLKLSIILSVTFFSYPLLYSFDLGQTTPVIFFFLCLIYYLSDHNYDKSAGIFLGLISLMKISPSLLILYFFLKKREKIVLTSLTTIFFLGLVSVLVFGVPVHLSYLSILRKLSGFDLVAWNNQSISAFLLRMGTHGDILKWQPIILKFPFNLFKLTILCGILGYSIKLWRNNSPSFPMEFSLIIFLILLLPPISWDHYFCFLVIPFLIIVDHLLMTEAKGYIYIIGFACLAYLLTIMRIDAYVLFQQLSQDSWIGKCLVSRIFLGASLLCLITLTLLRKQKYTK
jgi:hypothetical protein